MPSTSPDTPAGKPTLCEAALDGAPTCLFADDHGGRVMLWPKKAVDVFGVSREAALSTLMTRDVLGDPARFDDICKGMAKNGFFEEEVVFQRRDGASVSHRLTALPFPPTGGRIYHVLDIAPFRAIEAKLKHQAEQSRTLLDSLPDLFYQTDLSGKITYVNAAGTRMLKYNHPDDVIGRDLARDFYVDPGERGNFLTLLQSSGGVVKDWRVRLWRNDGKVAWVSAHSRYRHDPAGRVIGVEGMARDITDQIEADKRIHLQMEELERAYDQLKQAQSRLVHSEKMASLGVLMAGIAHEINNPVNFVYGNLDFMEKAIKKVHFGESPVMPDPGLLQDFRDALVDAKRGAGRVREIIDTLRNFARAGRKPLREEVCLDETIRDAIRLVSPGFKERIAITSELDQDLLVVGDRALLSQVWVNLLLNACQAIKGEGRVEVSSLATGRDALVRIRDDGPGIPLPLQESLFEPFISGREDGIGLGLSLSFDIVHGYGGELSFETEQGKGTVFEVRLPSVPGTTLCGG